MKTVTLRYPSHIGQCIACGVQVQVEEEFREVDIPDNVDPSTVVPLSKGRPGLPFEAGDILPGVCPECVRKGVSLVSIGLKDRDLFIEDEGGDDIIDKQTGRIYTAEDFEKRFGKIEDLEKRDEVEDNGFLNLMEVA